MQYAAKSRFGERYYRWGLASSVAYKEIIGAKKFTRHNRFYGFTPEIKFYLTLGSSLLENCELEVRT
jgi:hypothetical protein